MVRKKERRMKVVGQSGYKYRETPTIWGFRCRLRMWERY